MKTTTKQVTKSVQSALVTAQPKPVVGKPLQAHWATACFPMMSPVEFDALKEDIRLHGQQQYILVQKGEIIDGRHRVRACMELGLEPKFLEIGSDVVPEQAMVSNNLLRRHLTDSQRALIGARLVTSRLGTNQTAKGAVTQSKAAVMLGVSPDTIQRASKVLTTGNGALIESVASGKLTATEGAEMKDWPIEDLTTVLAAANDESFKDKVKETRQKVKQDKLAPRLQAIEVKRANNTPLATVNGTYEVFYIDPPTDHLSETQLGYPNMTSLQLAKLPVPAKAAKNSVCFLWVSASQVPLGLDLLRGWGFEYKAQLIWDKGNSGTGTYFRVCHEVLLLGTRGKPLVPKKSFASIVRVPRGKHSSKPVVFAEMIEAMYPGKTMLEMFCRGEARTGWDVWGNEAIPGAAQAKRDAAKPVAVTAKRGRPAKAANEGRFRKAA